jgi:hypothetical protein
MATTPGCGLRWLAADQDDAARRIHDASTSTRSTLPSWQKRFRHSDTAWCG